MEEGTGFLNRRSKDLMGCTGVVLKMNGLDGATIYDVFVGVALVGKLGNEGGHC